MNMKCVMMKRDYFCTISIIINNDVLPEGQSGILKRKKLFCFMCHLKITIIILIKMLESMKYKVKN